LNEGKVFAEITDEGRAFQFPDSGCSATDGPIG